MGYQVSKSGAKSWRLLFESKGSKPRNVPKHSDEARAKGFRWDMTLVEAKAHSLSLKADEKVERQIAAEGRAAGRLEKSRIKNSAFLPISITHEFEKNFLHLNKNHWARAQDVIADVAIPPEEWGEDWAREQIYECMKRYSISPGYAKKIRQMLNRYGRLWCKRKGKFFSPINAPTPSQARRMESARKRRGGKSLPLRPEQLKGARAQLKPSEYSWLEFSIWFGLRPEEVDNLQTINPTNWVVRKEGNQAALRVFQWKLFKRGTPAEKCWKAIPCLKNEQRLLLKLLGQPLKRPKNLKMQKIFGPGYTVYGGRKGFVALMLGLVGESEIFKVSKWIGHQSLLETQRSYEEVRDVYWLVVAEK